MANACRDPESRWPDPLHLHSSGDPGRRAFAGARGMKESARLLGYARRYWPLLIVSVALMAIVGAMTAARTLLIKPVLGRVLRPALDATPEPLFVVPVVNKALYLEQ